MTKALNQPLSVPYTEMKRGEHLKVLKVDEKVYEMVLYHAEVMRMTIRQAAEQMIQRGYLSNKAGERYSLTPYRLIGRGEPYKFLNISPQIYAILYDYARQNHCGIRFATEYLIKQCINAAQGHRWYENIPKGRRR